jgi:hypothetical protein
MKHCTIKGRRTVNRLAEVFNCLVDILNPLLFIIFTVINLCLEGQTFGMVEFWIRGVLSDRCVEIRMCLLKLILVQIHVASVKSVNSVTQLHTNCFVVHV